MIYCYPVWEDEFEAWKLKHLCPPTPRSSAFKAPPHATAPPGSSLGSPIKLQHVSLPSSQLGTPSRIYWSPNSDTDVSTSDSPRKRVRTLQEPPGSSAPADMSAEDFSDQSSQLTRWAYRKLEEADLINMRLKSANRKLTAENKRLQQENAKYYLTEVFEDLADLKSRLLSSIQILPS